MQARNVTVDQTLVKDPAAEAAQLAAVLGHEMGHYLARHSLDQLRDGCYDVHARIDDMDVNGVAASMCRWPAS